MSILGAILLWCYTQEHLFFVSPVEKVFPGEARVELKTNVPLDDVIGLELFVNDQAVAYFEEPPYRVKLDLKDFPDGETVIKAVLEMFNGMKHTAELKGENFVPDFREKVLMVQVPVSILGSVDASRLAANHFAILEDGRSQKVELMFGEEKPMELMVLLDLSGSMHRRLTHLRLGLNALIDLLREKDSLEIIGFNSRVFQVSPRETDMAVVKKNLLYIEAIGSTNLYGAIWSGLRTLGKTTRRKAIVLFTDGDHDLDGELDLYKKTRKDCIDLARENGIPIYAVGIGATVKPEVLNEISISTGGKTFVRKDPKFLNKAFESIGEQLRRQFLVCYYTSSRLSGWHRIEVSLPDSSEIQLRYPSQLYFKF